MTAEVVITVAGTDYLLAALGRNYHAVRRADEEHHEDHGRWSPRTLCGRRWWNLGDEYGDPLLGWQPAVAPTCRGCLRIVTQGLAETAPDDRLNRLVDAMCGAVITYGSAQCSGVPGDQADRLRKALAVQLRAPKRRIQTIHSGDLVVVSDDLHRGHREVDNALRAAMDAIVEPQFERGASRDVDRARPPHRPWLFAWKDWDSPP